RRGRDVLATRSGRVGAGGVNDALVALGAPASGPCPSPGYVAAERSALRCPHEGRRGAGPCAGTAVRPTRSARPGPRRAHSREDPPKDGDDMRYPFVATILTLATLLAACGTSAGSPTPPEPDPTE